MGLIPILDIQSNTLIVVLGPTASGKTDVAVSLAEKLGAEILSADSRQFYKEMSIGTAKPGKEQMRRVKHHFVGHLSIMDYYNAARFEKEAMELLTALFQHSSYAIMAGGSGLYIDAVCKGIDELPDPDPQLREDLKNELRDKGIEYMRSLLKELDPEYYLLVDQNNPSRILRALEVCKMTGEPYSSLRKNKARMRDFEIRKYGIDMPREELNRRIGARVDSMMEAGLLQEVKSLHKYRHLNALNTVGYKELFEYLDGVYSLQEAIEKIKTNTRRYAKRQMTWFKRDTNIHWLKEWADLPLL